MTNDRAAEALAAKLHFLSHPDGIPRRLMQFSRASHSEDQNLRVSQAALELAQAIIHTLAEDGFELYEVSR